MEAVTRAMAQQGPFERGATAGNMRCRLVFAGPAQIASTMRPLVHRFDPANAATDATFFVGDAASTGIALPAPPWSPGSVTVPGFVPEYCVGGIRFAYDAIIGAITGADLERRIGFQWLRQAGPLPSYLYAKPLRALFHWFLQHRGLRMTHAAGVGMAGRGALLTGRAGIGKSTTSLACAAAGMSFLGDDFVALELGPPVVGYNVFASANLFPDNLARFPDLALGGIPDPIDFAHEHVKPKHTIFVAERRPGAVPERLPIDVILVPNQGGVGIERIGAVAALRAVAPSSLILLPGDDRASLRFFAQLCQSVPCFSIGVGPDLHAIPQLVQQALRSVA
ncbi:MAG: hypothetical protein AB7G15_11635 [Alphaproteobacteria bacterium]